MTTTIDIELSDEAYQRITTVKEDLEVTWPEFLERAAEVLSDSTSHSDGDIEEEIEDVDVDELGELVSKIVDSVEEVPETEDHTDTAGELHMSRDDE